MNRAQLFTLAGLMIAANTASATSISFQGLDASRSASVWMDVTYLAGETMVNGHVATQTTHATEKVGAGVMQLSFDGSLQLQDAFCVDRFNDISNGNYTVNLSAPNSIANGERAAWMLHSVLPQINSAPVGTQQANMAAALQLAIWDVVHDSGDGFSAGRVQMSSSQRHPTNSIILNLAQSFISASSGKAYTEALVITDVNLGPLTQRQMVDRPGSNVPEPSTWALALTGLAWAALRRAKRF